jgi:hypothetical protein
MTDEEISYISMCFDGCGRDEQMSNIAVIPARGGSKHPLKI